MKDREIRPVSDEIAVIKLKGYPYQQERDGSFVDSSQVLEQLALNSDYDQKLGERIADNLEHLTPLIEGGYYGIDAKLKKGESLSYSEAFSLMTFVSMGVNRSVHREVSPLIQVGATDPDTVFYQSISLLSAMSAKEGFVGLTPEEIAGMTAATLEIDTIVRVPSTQSIVGIGGMGGDRGYPKNGENSKLFSLSTMGAIVLADSNVVHKHHSYPNTSRVAGQSAIEAFGGRSDQSSPESLEYLQEKVGLLMSSCHTTRLIHTLSHRLKGETINHVVGPLSLPVDKETEVTAFIGVNDNVHPETIIESLRILNEHGVQKYSNSVAFCGLNGQGILPEHFNPRDYYKNHEARSYVAIDEVAPPPYSTLAAFLVEGQNRGTFVIEPSDFMEEDLLSQVVYSELLIPNTVEDIMSANIQALRGEDTAKTLYLAMTAALAIFTKDYAHLPNALDEETRRVNKEYLHEAYARALESITSQRAYEKLVEYVSVSQQTV